MAEMLSRGLITSRVTGVPESLAACRGIKKQFNIGCEEGVRKACEYLLRESNKVTPIDTGFLRSTGDFFIQGKGSKAKGTLYYTAYYAIYVHEDLTTYHAPGTYAKFLERTIKEKGRYASATITRTINSKLGKFR